MPAQKLVAAQAEARELIGPAQPAPQKDGLFTVEDFHINVEKRTAICPAGKTNTQYSRLANPWFKPFASSCSHPDVQVQY